MLYIILLALLIAFVFGWNNSGLFTGGLTGSGLLSYKKSVALTSLGLILGALIEGGKMGRTLIGFMTESTTIIALSDVFITTFLLMLIFTLLHIPVSLSHVSVGAYVGANFAIGLSLNTATLGLILLSWLLVPAFSALITILIYKFIARIAQRFSLLTLDAFNRVAVIIVTFYITYALGANNVGLINGLYMPLISDSIFLEFMIIVMAMSVALGVVTFGKRITKTVGEDLIILSPISVLTSMFSSALLMWLFTQFSIPISITQAFIGGIFGASLIKRHVMFNRIILYEIVGSWVAITAISFISSMLIMKAFV
ncbi:MAG: inorganic phosphate transporter [archaeon]|nr:inorganic phosphate transporter [archaeon]